MKSVCLNGTFVEPAELADPLSMLERNHLFQRIHTFGGTAPFLSVHLEILTRALNRLYGMQTDLSESRIADPGSPDCSKSTGFRDKAPA